MTAKLTIFALPLLLCAAAQAATVNTTLTVTNAAISINASVVASGPATLTGGIGSGTFVGTLSLATFSGTFAIDIGTDEISGTMTLSPTIVTGNGTGTMQVTGGKGKFVGATGSFTLTGSGSVTSVSFSGPGSITAAGLTGGGTGGTPSITGVVNNYSFVPPGFPNSNISPGTLFVLTGSNLADPSAQAVLQDSSKGLPLTLNGASITVTAGGSTFHPALYYAIAGQLAAVLPAATPTGTASVTVSYNNTTSAAFQFQVVPATLGIGTYNGLAIATDLNYTLLTYTNSAKPGDTIVLWGSGLGAIAQDSDTTYTAAPHAASAKPQILIGGIPATVIYAGDSGFPGLNQIDVTIPLNAPTGCTVSLVGVTGTGSTAISSNATVLSISANGGICTDPLTGLTGTTIQNLQGKVRSGSLFVIKSTMPATSGSGTTVSDTASAIFTSGGASFNTSIPSVGSCSLVQSSSTLDLGNGIDAGTISVSGPVSSATLQSSPSAPGFYGATPAVGFIPSTGGAFTFKGTGGAGTPSVGSFSVTVNIPNPLLTWTNTIASANVDRTAGANITWTGGGSNSYVYITGKSTSGSASGTFNCFTTASAGQFTVPSSILLGIPAGTGTLSVENVGNYTTFSATGLDSGFAFGGDSQQINTTYK